MIPRFLDNLGLSQTVQYNQVGGLVWVIRFWRVNIGPGPVLLSVYSRRRRHLPTLGRVRYVGLAP